MIVLRRMRNDELRLLLVRHGETESNALGRYIGWGDSPLSDDGRRQAAAIAQRMEAMPIDAFYASDLGRAAETAGAIARVRGTNVQRDERLRERNYGVFEGLPYEEARRRFPDIALDLDRFDVDCAIPEGESARQVRERVASFTRDLLALHRGRTVLAVCHGGSVRTFLWHLLDLPYRAIRAARCDNTSVSSFRYLRDQWQLELWNDTAHWDGFADDRRGMKP